VLVVGWILVAGGVASLTYTAIRFRFGPPTPADRRGRLRENTRVGCLWSVVWGWRPLDHAWLGVTLLGIGLGVIGLDSRHHALGLGALCATWALLILKSVLDGRRQRKVEALLRQRRRPAADQAEQR
jgi:hypothetical protein